MGLDLNEVREWIEKGKTSLGIELGSTRIKAVLIGENFTPIASGSHDWENRLENNIWTYSLEDIWTGIQHSYADMAGDVREKYGVTLTTAGSIGFSAMMHGYMVFDREGRLLVPFRTWRNTITGPASGKLTELFRYNVPQRWSIAHLYQAILNKEEHVKDIDYMITLEGYVHWMLTGKKALGIGDVAGMFPVDPDAKDFDQKCVEQFDRLVEGEKLPWKLRDILPEALVAGEDAGVLTRKGRSFWIRQAILRQEFPCVLLRETREPVWWPPTAWPAEREMSLPGPAFLPWWFWRRRLKTCILRLIWLPPCRRSGCYGSLQQLHLGFERLGKSV